MGGGYFNKLLTKDVKEINKVFLSLFSVGIILVAIFVGLNITKSSYALFRDNITGNNIIEVEVDTCNLYVPNRPILDTNMIPVYYDETAEVWKKADSTNQDKNYQWYDYCEKKWANSVTVTSSSRSTYLNADLGTEIDMDDILTMQVWVPRYKYKVWNYNADGAKTSEPQEIEIVFEQETSSTGEITCTDTISGTDGAKSESCKINNIECTDSTCNNKYYTHPAFTFGEEELTGFWVGKFELTGTIDSITIKPNISSIRSQKVSSFETNIMKMNDSGNQYGLSTNADTHMIKNIEWGAVSYLSHSRYGTCQNGTCVEIGINNNTNHITGCGSEVGIGASTTCNSYDTELGMQASTTGNIYGVYDMSGSSYEIVMGNIVSKNGSSMISGQTSGYGSGYSGILYNNGNYTSYTGISYPATKYYDKYSFNTDNAFVNLSKLGDATKETYININELWYDDAMFMPTDKMSWIFRGGYHSNNVSAGLFHTNNYVGAAYADISTRLIISS